MEYKIVDTKNCTLSLFRTKFFFLETPQLGPGKKWFKIKFWYLQDFNILNIDNFLRAHDKHELVYPSFSNNRLFCRFLATIDGVNDKSTSGPFRSNRTITAITNGA